MRIKYVAKERTRGRIRYRFQRDGRKVTLRGEPGSAAFMAHYAELLGGPVEATQAPLEGTIRWLASMYLEQLETRVGAGLASPATLKGHRHHLGRLVAAYGDFAVSMQKHHVERFLDQYLATPGARDNLRKSISAMFMWGMERNHAPANPARGVKKINTQTDGFYTCTVDDVRRYLLHHGPGTMARRTMILELCTAARREDLRLLGPQHVKQIDGVDHLRWRQSKSPNKWVEIPILPLLAEEVAGHAGPAFILSEKGKPYTNGSFGNAVKDWFTRAGASGTLHGVRKGLSSIMAELGATSYEVDVLLGHELGSKETRGYIEGARRAEIARGLSVKMGKMKW